MVLLCQLSLLNLTLVPLLMAKIVVGAVVLVLLLIFMIFGILWWKGCMGGRKSREKGTASGRLKLDCPVRQKICVGIARGLALVHEESILKIVHRDIKFANLLLDDDFNPKISDFGLGKLYEEENIRISTRISGTMVRSPHPPRL